MSAGPVNTSPSGRPRARALGIPFDGETGPANSVTDVPGVSVGYATLIRGAGALAVGQGPVRTGVTAILPRPADALLTPLWAGFFSLNGNGELSGAHWIDEVGQLSGPITITNTHSCGVARDATVAWLARRFPDAMDDAFSLPVAAETFDGFLNDINGFHVTSETVSEAIEAARDGPIEEGSVGGGTGMISFEFKAGSGTASRRLRHAGRDYMVGAFVQANFGPRRALTVRGKRLGRQIREPALRPPRSVTPTGEPGGSIIAVLATDLPLLPHQARRLAKRSALGMARTGGLGGHRSGDLFLAFSTANAAALSAPAGSLLEVQAIADDPSIDAVFEAAADATEEAILNSLVVNADMTGRDGHYVPALPHAALADLDW